jgi:hypothetical protein
MQAKCHHHAKTRHLDPQLSQSQMYKAALHKNAAKQCRIKKVATMCNIRLTDPRSIHTCSYIVQRDSKIKNHPPGSPGIITFGKVTASSDQLQHQLTKKDEYENLNNCCVISRELSLH